MCVELVFNIEAGNDYSKSTFIMILIKQDNIVFILVILFIRHYLSVFTKLFILDCLVLYELPILSYTLPLKTE